MMTKEKSPFRNRFKYLVALPLVIILSLMVCGRMAQSQDPPKEPIADPEIIEVVASEEEVNTVTQDEPVFVLVEKSAQFQGGDLQTFRNWIQKQLIYPPEAIANNIQGKITVQFVVNSIGKVCDIEILRGVDPLLDNEAIRVVGISPDWTPAKVGGKSVKQQFVFPIIFSLSDKGSAGNNPPPPPPSPEQIAKFKEQERASATEGHAFVFVDQQAKFQGGTIEDFIEWIQTNLVYPPVAKENGITGKVIAQFAVNNEGKVFDVKIARGVDPSLDQEVLRVLQKSPVWTPAENDGKKVTQQFVIPVFFSPEKKPVAGTNPEQDIVEKQPQIASENQEGEPAFVFVEQEASFQGGSLETFREWVQKNLVYPAIAKENGIFGRITIQFAVNSKGKVCDIKVLRSVDPSLDKEAIRVVSSSPDWVPARQKGKNVKQLFVMPVIFQLM